LGQDDVKRSQIRVITCTNKDLWAMQRTEKFRKDLNFRLRTHHVDIPPLRDRKDDIPLLVDHFIRVAAESMNREPAGCEKDLTSLLNSYSFPGNVRELKAVIFDAVSRNKNPNLTAELFTGKLIEREENKPEKAEPAAVGFPKELPTIKRATRMLVEEALSRAGGNQAVAAKMLGISRQALGKRIKMMQGE
ncbi:MAG: helix-turn-helix domain-containing protein, partial [Nitrospinota bacterium]